MRAMTTKVASQPLGARPASEGSTLVARVGCPVRLAKEAAVAAGSVALRIRYASVLRARYADRCTGSGVALASFAGVAAVAGGTIAKAIIKNSATRTGLVACIGTLLMN